MGNHTTRLDAKGRLSIPANFRSTLKAGSEDGSQKLILWPSHQHPCIEAWPEPEFAKLEDSVERLDIFSADEDALRTMLYGQASSVEPDKEGRLIVNESLVRHAGLTDSVFFIGRGKTFRIWAPEPGLQSLTASTHDSNVRKLVLPGPGRLA